MVAAENPGRFNCSTWSLMIENKGETTIFDDIPSQDRKGFSDVRICDNTKKQLKNYALAETGGKHGKNVFPPGQIKQSRFCSNNRTNIWEIYDTIIENSVH